MYYFVSTRLGRQTIPMLANQDRDEEVAILGCIHRVAATAQEISDRTGIEYDVVCRKLSQMVENRWVNRRRPRRTLLY